SASWRRWEIVAAWALKSQPAPDLSRPKRLLEQEIANADMAELPAILDSALKTGLVRADQVSSLKDYETRLRRFLDAPASDRISPGYDDWVIRAAVLRSDLTPTQRDHLAERLHANLKWSFTRNTPGTLDEPRRATELLALLGRPVKPVQYQREVHD